MNLPSRRFVVSLLAMAGTAVGCAVGAEPDVSPSAIAADAEPTEPAPGPSLPGPSNPEGEETGGNTGGNTGGDAGGGGGGGTTQDAGGGTGGGGGTTTAPKATQGDLVISEIMYDCSGTEPLGEWIEVKNLRNAARSLSGLTLEDSGARTHVIGANVILPANGYAVLARSTSGATAAGVPASTILYAYGDGLAPSAGVLLGNGSTGSILLRDGNTKLAEVIYGGWYSTSGGSIQLKTLGTTQMSSKSNWCVSASPFGTGADLGTPGAACDCP